jgi:flagellar protein FlgJ
LEDSKLKDACRDFEAIFIKQMLDSMRKTVQKTGLNDGGMAEDIFEDFLYDEYSKVMAKTGSFGISELLYRQFKDVVPNS